MQTEKEVADLFTDINKSEPVKQVDLPDAPITVKDRCVVLVLRAGDANPLDTLNY